MLVRLLKSLSNNIIYGLWQSRFFGTASSVLHTGVAQLVEQWSPKPKVVSSILTSRAKKNEMESLKAYVVGAYQELLHKVTWPSWAELQSNGVIVFVASAIIGIIVLLMDLASKNVTDVIYKFLMSL